MRKIISITLLISVLFSFTGCSSYLQTANGAYSDISLTRDPDGYTVKRLAEVKETGKAFWGIPKNNKNKKQGMIFRFNGINLDQANGFWPTLSLIGMSTFGSLTIAGIINPGWFYYEEYATLLLSTAITLPITGAINNAIWSNSAYQTAAFNLNSKLLVQNPDVDVFLNPKYEVYKNNGLWSQEAKIKANVMGARIKVDGEVFIESSELKSSETEITGSIESNNSTSIENIAIKSVVKTVASFEVGDIVSFSQHISDSSGVNAEFKIPDGVIYKISGDKLYINYIFEGDKYRTRKNSDEVELVKKR